MRRIILLVCLSIIPFAVPSAASAALTIAPSGPMTATTIGTLHVNSPIGTLRCSVTMSLTLNAGPITSGGVGGSVTGFSFQPHPCMNVRWTAQSLPWQVTYTRPITVGSVYLFTIVGSTILAANFFGANCEYGGNLPFAYTNATGIASLLSNVLTGTNLPPTLPICGNVSLAGSGFQFQRIGGVYPQGAGS